MRQSFPYPIQFYLQLRLAYSWHYRKVRKAYFIINNEADIHQIF